MVARCETVLNTTMAEMDVYHTQKSEDLKAITVDHLDGEIALYEQVPAVCPLPRVDRMLNVYLFVIIDSSPSKSSAGYL